MSSRNIKPSFKRINLNSYILHKSTNTITTRQCYCASVLIRNLFLCFEEQKPVRSQFVETWRFQLHNQHHLLSYYILCLGFHKLHITAACVSPLIAIHAATMTASACFWGHSVSFDNIPRRKS